MNEHTPESNREEPQARLTALLLGELPDEQAAALRRDIEHDPELAKLYRQLEKTIVLVREVAAPAAEEEIKEPAAPLRLSEERRQKLLAHFKTVAPKEFARPKKREVRWLVELAAAAAIIGILAAIALPNLGSFSTKRSARAKIGSIDQAKSEYEDVSGQLAMATATDQTTAKKTADEALGRSGQNLAVSGQVDAQSEHDAVELIENDPKKARALPKDRPPAAAAATPPIDLNGHNFYVAGSAGAPTPQAPKPLSNNIILPPAALAAGVQAFGASNAYSLNIVGYASVPTPKSQSNPFELAPNDIADNLRVRGGSPWQTVPVAPPVAQPTEIAKNNIAFANSVGTTTDASTAKNPADGALKWANGAAPQYHSFDGTTNTAVVYSTTPASQPTASPAAPPVELAKNGVFLPNTVNSLNYSLGVSTNYIDANGFASKVPEPKLEYKASPESRGEPEWLGLLLQTNSPQSTSNQFIGRYGYVVNNLKQDGSAFKTRALDNKDQYPKAPTQELAQAGVVTPQETTRYLTPLPASGTPVDAAGEPAQPVTGLPPSTVSTEPPSAGGTQEAEQLQTVTIRLGNKNEFNHAIETIASGTAGSNLSMSGGGGGVNVGGGVQPPTTKGTPQDKLGRFAQALGVDLNTNSGESLSYNERDGTITLRAKPKDLDVIGAAVLLLDSKPPDVHIAAKFAEVTPDNSKPQQTQLYTRVINVDTNAIDQFKLLYEQTSSSGAVGGGGGGAAPSLNRGPQAVTASNDMVAVQKGVRLAFRDAGVDLKTNAGEYFAYNDREGKLLVRAPQEQLDKIESAARSLNNPQQTNPIRYANPSDIHQALASLSGEQNPVAQRETQAQPTTANGANAAPAQSPPLLGDIPVLGSLSRSTSAPTASATVSATKPPEVALAVPARPPTDFTSGGISGHSHSPLLVPNTTNLVAWSAVESGVVTATNMPNDQFRFYYDANRNPAIKAVDEAVRRQATSLSIESGREREVTASEPASTPSSVPMGAFPNPGGSAVPSTPAEQTKTGAPTLVQDGKLLFEMGKFDEAEAKLKAATKADPSNQAANYYLNRLNEKRLDDAQNKGDVRSREKLLAVENNNWNFPGTNNSPNVGSLGRVRATDGDSNSHLSDDRKKETPERAPKVFLTGITTVTGEPMALLQGSNSFALKVQGGSQPESQKTPARVRVLEEQLAENEAKLSAAQTNSDRLRESSFQSRLAGVVNRAAAPGVITNLEKLNLPMALDYYGSLVGRRVTWPTNMPNATVGITSPKTLTKEETIRALDAAFGMNGIGMINVGDKFVKAVPLAQVNQQAGAFNKRTAEQLADLSPYVTHVVQLKNAKPTEILPFLVSLASIPNAILANDNSGMIVLRDKPEVVRQFLEVIREKDSDKAAPATPRPTPSADAPVPQPEFQTRDNAFSTFSMNVSDVSFKLAAASLEKGMLPESASIRSEEFINAFDYRDPEAPPGVPVAFAYDRASYPFAQNRDLLRFSLKTAAEGREPGRPLNLVLLLDTSGSMERADRVRIIHEALRVLAAQLTPSDVFSVVTFARTPRLWVDGIPGHQAGKVAEEVGNITPEGGTNLEEAMNLAYQTALRHYLANGVNRVVLLTDGAANLGNVDPAGLKQKVEANRKQGISLDCFGVGWEGYNDDLLELLTRDGNGRYGFINTPEEAATDFAGQLAGALRVAAADVKVQVEFNPARVTAYRQIGYAKHQLTKEQFRDNTVAAAQLAASESGNALYTVEINPRGEGPLCTVRVRYRVPATSEYHEHEWAVPYTGNAPALEQSAPAMRLSATAAAFSEWLAASPYATDVTPERLLGYLSGVPEICGADARPKKLQWMLRQAQSIEGKR